MLSLQALHDFCSLYDESLKSPGKIKVHNWEKCKFQGQKKDIRNVGARQMSYLGINFTMKGINKSLFLVFTLLSVPSLYSNVFHSIAPPHMK